GAHQLVMVSPENHMTYQPFLPEVASGLIDPRAVVVPLRSALRRTRLILGEVERIDVDGRSARIRLPDGRRRDEPFDVAVIGAGSSIAAATVVWTAGVRPSPLASASGLPVDDRGRVRVDRALRVEGIDGLWAAGDVAAVPDPDDPSGSSPPTAQHALRQAKLLAEN